MAKAELVQALRSLTSMPKQRMAIPAEKPVERPVTRQQYLELPKSYGVTELVLLPIDPHWIFAYWEVTPQALSDLMNRLGPRASQGRYVLRIYDVTAIEFTGSNAHSFFDLPVDLSARNWYINLWSSEKSLVGDLGYLLPDAQFLLLVRSNVVQTARSGVSIFTEARWAKPFIGQAGLRFYSEEPCYLPVPGQPVTGPTLWAKLIEASLAFSSGPGQPFSLFRPRTQSGQEMLK
jgi:hypothetical protein